MPSKSKQNYHRFVGSDAEATTAEGNEVVEAVLLGLSVVGRGGCRRRPDRRCGGGRHDCGHNHRAGRAARRRHFCREVSRVLYIIESDVKK